MHDADLDRLFTEHAQRLYGFLAYRTGDSAIAEDLLGDTFERVVRSHDRFNARKGSEATWIYTIALNCLRDHLRHKKAEGRAIDRAGSPQEPHEPFTQIHERDEMGRALARLEPGEREILSLRFGADLRLRDIAKVTGLPETTVQGRLYSGLRKLRAALEPNPASANRLRPPPG